MAERELSPEEIESLGLNKERELSPSEVESLGLEPKKAAEPMPVEKTGVGEALARGAGHGFTFGFGDEINGAIQAAGDKLSGSDKPYGELYHRNRDMFRREDDKAASDQPLAYHGASFVSTLPVAIATGGAGAGGGGAASTMGALRAIGTGAKVGGAWGAIQGAGDSRSSDAGGLARDVGKSAGIGALSGGALGGVGYEVGNVARGASSAVRRYIASKLAGQESRLLENVASAGPKWSPPELPSNAGGEVSMSGEHPTALPELDGPLPSVASRQARQGGEVNAALNNAQNRLAQGQAARALAPGGASDAEREAAQLLAGRGRSFSEANPRSTPEYQNSGDLTRVAPEAEIAGARNAGPAPRPAALPRQSVVQRRPQINPEFQAQAGYSDPAPATVAGRGQRALPSDAMETRFGDGMAPEPTQVNSPATVRQQILSGRPDIRPDFRGRATGPLPELPVPEQGPHFPDRAGAIQGALEHPANDNGSSLLLGAVKGGYQGAKSGAKVSIPLGLANHALGGIAEGASAGAGAVKGAYGAMSDAAKAKLLAGAGSAFETPEWRANLYRSILKNSAATDSGSYGNQDDRRD